MQKTKHSLPTYERAITRVKQAAEQNPDELLYSLNDLNAATAKLREDAHLFGEIMAVMNGDGGHYQAAHGSKAAYERALKRWYQQLAHQQPSGEPNIGGDCKHGYPAGRHCPICEAQQPSACPKCGYKGCLDLSAPSLQQPVKAQQPSESSSCNCELCEEQFVEQPSARFPMAHQQIPVEQPSATTPELTDEQYRHSQDGGYPDE